MSLPVEWSKDERVTYREWVAEELRQGWAEQQIADHLDIPLDAVWEMTEEIRENNEAQLGIDAHDRREEWTEPEE